MAGLKVEPGRKDRMVFDSMSPGLGLRVTAKGTRTFIFQWTDPPTRRKVREPITIGGATITRLSMKRVTALGFLFGFGIACTIAFSAQADDLRTMGDCYPGNHFTITGTGKTFASGSAEGKITNIIDNNGAEVQLQFVGVITLDAISPLQGRLTASIRWDDPTLTGGVEKTEFDTGCVQKIQTKSQIGSLGGFEGEFEGGVADFPGYPGTTKASIGSLVVKNDDAHPGKIEVDLSIQLGITCNENNSLDHIEFASIALTNLSPSRFKVKNLDRGEWSFPLGRSPTTSPCDSEAF